MKEWLLLFSRGHTMYLPYKVQPKRSVDNCDKYQDRWLFCHDVGVTIDGVWIHEYLVV
jgi:hypothetical protein